jgi:hypothetical protein
MNIEKVNQFTKDLKVLPERNKAIKMKVSQPSF